MSRIIKSIVNNLLGTIDNQYLMFHSNALRDVQIAKLLGGKCFTFSKNPIDTQNFYHIISDKELGENLNIMPQYVINTSLVSYQNAKNVSELFKVPLFNILDNIDNLKKEGIFNLAAIIDQDFNLLSKKEFADKLFLTKYLIVSNIEEIPQIIKEKLNTWKPI